MKDKSTNGMLDGYMIKTVREFISVFAPSNQVLVSSCTRNSQAMLSV